MLNHPFRKVLIVDDSPMLLHLLDRVLSAGGYEVHQARNGHEALQIMQDECCDFVVTDWHMPTMDGIELCRQIRSMSWPQYVFIAVLTSSDSSDDLIAALDAGADDFYIKPVVAPELLARMRAGSRFLALERQLRIQARLDPLTEVLNRRTFEEMFSREWNYAERHGTQLSCVMMDVDYFKSVNDRFGHPAGDAVLRSLSQILRDESRTPDYVARYGGEEFCVMLPQTDEIGAAAFAERCRMAIMNGPILTAEGSVNVTASFGVAQRDCETSRPDHLLGRADQALLWAKRQGRNRVYTHLASRTERTLAIVSPNRSANESLRNGRELIALYEAIEPADGQLARPVAGNVASGLLSLSPSAYFGS
ncbi:MAG: diguanylate cyclase [Planctomycetota bacterium]